MIDAPPTIIIEGGLVRDVVGSDSWNVIDLDLISNNSTAYIEELEDVLEQVMDLPEDYPDRAAIAAAFRERIDQFQTYPGGT